MRTQPMSHICIDCRSFWTQDVPLDRRDKRYETDGSYSIACDFCMRSPHGVLVGIVRFASTENADRLPTRHGRW
jgi:hypothetical protein